MLKICSMFRIISILYYISHDKAFLLCLLKVLIDIYMSIMSCVFDRIIKYLRVAWTSRKPLVQIPA